MTVISSVMTANQRSVVTLVNVSWALCPEFHLARATVATTLPVIRHIRGALPVKRPEQKETGSVVYRIPRGLAFQVSAEIWCTPGRTAQPGGHCPWGTAAFLRAHWASLSLLEEVSPSQSQSRSPKTPLLIASIL